MILGGVLLAAGAGRRFGGPKALIELDGEFLVERGARMLAQGGCDEVVVVLGAGAEEVRDRARPGAARVVVNERWTSGMGSSLAVGLAALGDSCGACVVALADQPRVGPESVRRLAAAWHAGAAVAVATYGGRRRNPVLLDRAWWPEITEALSGDEGARVFLRARPELVTPVPCDDTGSPDDVDTPADLFALTAEER